MDLMNGCFGRVAPGMCRLSMNGEIAVKTTGGYKTYDPATNHLTNCSSFVLDVGEDLFFVLPAKKVTPGDIILVGGKPKCVVKQEADHVTVINYEDAVIENILPERNLFLGDTYFFSRLVSVFGRGNAKNGKKGAGRLMRYMMLAELFRGKGNSGRDPQMNPMLMMAMAGGGLGMNDMFDDLFDEKGED